MNRVPGISASFRAFRYDSLAREHARSRPHRLAVVDGDVRLTYAELDERVDRLAHGLASLGVVTGSRVLWLGQNSFRVLELLLACSRLGAVLCPANWRQSAAEMTHVVDDLDPTVVVWQDTEIGETVRTVRDVSPSSVTWLQHDDPDGYERLVAAPDARPGDPLLGEPPVDPCDALLAMYTAAFAGRPRAAMLSHIGLLFQDLVIGRMQDVTDETVFLNSGPLFHVATFVTTSATFHHGGTNVFVPRVDPAEICSVVDAERCTHAFLMPPTIEQIGEFNRDGRFDMSSLWAEPDATRYRSGMVSPVDSPWMRRPGGYGQTEVVGLTTLRGLGSESAGGAGRPSPASLVRILTEDGADVAPGEIGELAVSGPTVMVGYRHGAPSDDGWHRTSDLGRREPDGSITFVGPKGRLIKSGAENIYPAEVELCLRTHPDVADACVIGVPDARWGQSIRAVVVAGDGRQLEEAGLIEHCRTRIASYKKPRSVVIAPSLPRTPQGAVDRDAVDAAFGGGGYPGSG